MHQCKLAVGTVAIATISVTACSRDSSSTAPPAPPSYSQLSGVTTSEARGNVNDVGHFIVLSENQAGERTAGEAGEMANAYAQAFLPYIQPWIEHTRGAGVDRKLLRACGRPLYAESVFEPIAETEPIGVRNGFGSYWLITLCAKDEPQVSVAVAATNLGARLVRGKFVDGSVAGGEFFAFGIPKGHRGEFPISPEAAAVLGARHAVARVSSTPRLVLPLHSDGIPQNAKWVMDLDRPVTLKTESGALRDTREISIGADFGDGGAYRTSEFVAADTQPTSIPYQYMPLESSMRSAIAVANTKPLLGVARVKSNVAAKFSRLDERN